MVRPGLKDAYFTAIKYPVLAAAAHARKLLHGSEEAYQEIQELTHYYNKEVGNGKWNGLMDMQPRKLPVFDAPKGERIFVRMDSLAGDGKVVHPIEQDGTIARNAADYQEASKGAEAIDMLGHSMEAVSLPKNGTLSYDFDIAKDGDALLKVAVIPTQPNDKGDLRFSVSVDGAKPTVYSL